MKRLGGFLIFGAVVLVSLLATDATARNVPSTTSLRSSLTAIPAPVKEALSVVESSRKAGPLRVDQNAGSVMGGAWTAETTGQSPGVIQHWSVLASDSKGRIVLGIIVMDNGTEAVSGWVPGASHATNWIFNRADPSTSVRHMTVTGSTHTMWSRSPRPSSDQPLTSWTDSPSVTARFGPCPTSI